MPTSKEQLREWFDAGVEKGASYMIVRCDTFECDDYPSYHNDETSAQMVVKNPGAMQKVMEVYDLKKPRAEQLDMRRCHALT